MSKLQEAKAKIESIIEEYGLTGFFSISTSDDQQVIDKIIRPKPLDSKKGDTKDIAKLVASLSAHSSSAVEMFVQQLYLLFGVVRLINDMSIKVGKPLKGQELKDEIYADMSKGVERFFNEMIEDDDDIAPSDKNYIRQIVNAVKKDYYGAK